VSTEKYKMWASKLLPQTASLILMYVANWQLRPQVVHIWERKT